MGKFSRGIEYIAENGVIPFFKVLRRYLYKKIIETGEPCQTCAVCTSPHIGPVLKEYPSSLFKCRDCGLVFYNPLPLRRSLDEFYSSEEGYLPSIKDTMRFHDENHGNRSERFEGFLDKITGYCPTVQKILDIGCGFGFFLMHCRGKGLKPFGLEVSRQTSAWARDQGLDVHRTLRGQARFSDIPAQVNGER